MKMAVTLFFEILIFLLIIWVVWVLLGGPARYESENKPFIRSPIEESPLTPYGPTVN